MESKRGVGEYLIPIAPDTEQLKRKISLTQCLGMSNFPTLLVKLTVGAGLAVWVDFLSNRSALDSSPGLCCSKTV